MKIPANSEFVKFFQLANHIAEEATMTITDGSLMTIEALDPAHVSIIELKYMPPNGTPVDQVGTEFKRGVRLKFLYNAIKNGMTVAFNEQNMEAATTEASTYSKRRVTQKYVTTDNGGVGMTEELVQKHLPPGDGVFSASLGIDQIQAAEKFGIDLQRAVALTIDGTSVKASLTSQELGLDYESGVGSVTKAPEQPTTILVKYPYMAPLKAFCRFGHHIDARMAPKLPLLFHAEYQSATDGGIAMRYLVAPVIEAEEEIEQVETNQGPAPAEQDEERPETVESEESGESEETEETEETEEEEQTETEEEEHQEETAPIPSAQ